MTSVQRHLHSPSLQPQLGSRVRGSLLVVETSTTHFETQLQLVEPQAAFLGTSKVVYEGHGGQR